MKIKTRMLAGTSLLFVLCACALLVALMGMQGARERFEHFLRTDEALLQASMGMYADGLQSGQALRNIVMDPSNPTAYKNLETATTDFLDRARKAQELAPAGSADRKLLEEVLTRREALAAIQTRIVQLARSDQAAATLAVNKEETPAWRQIRQSLLDFSKAKSQGVEASKQDVARYTAQVLVVSLAVMGVALVAGGFTMFLLVRALLRDLGGEPAYAREVASRIAGGDLTGKVDVKDGDRASMLYAMQQMLLRLRELVGEVAAGAHAVADGSAQIAQGNLDLSQRTEEQATTLEETASSMEELTSTVAQNAEHARQASGLAVGASEVARKGGQVVGEVVTTMSGISESSSKIADIIGVIDGIAFQTNILALNAAVEAARAGEQGRGFAVVAAEVRSLAQRSASAAKEIKDLIGDSVQKVQAGTELVDSAGRTMDEIVAAVKKVSELVAEIASASQEQSNGISQVGTAVAQMDQVVAQNASMVEEATAATDALKSESEALLRSVSRFRLGQEAAPLRELAQAKKPEPASAPVLPIRVKPSAPRLGAEPAAAGPAPAARDHGREGWSEF